MISKKLVFLTVPVVMFLTLSALSAAGPKGPPVSAPASVQKGADHEEDNYHGRVPLIPDTDPVFSGKIEGIKAMAEAIRRGLVSKPMIRAYERLYPRLYPFDHRFELGVAVSVAAQGRPETMPSWTFLGPTNIPGRITALVRHPSDAGTLYVGAADGGVWKTSDAGSNWTPLTDFAQTLAIGSMAMNPQNPNELWVGTGEGNFAIDNYPGGAIYHTTDGGVSWTTLTHGFGDIRGLAVKPDGPTTLYAAAGTRNGGASGILKSVDGGATWALLGNGIPSGIGTEVIVDPSSTVTVYGVLGDIFGSSANGIYKSTDGGASFTKLSGGFPDANVGRISLALAPSQPSILYAAVQSSSTYSLLGFYKSLDGGATWTNQNLTGAAGSFCSGQCWYDMEVAVDPANADKVYLGGIDTYRSSDGGKNFVQLSQWYLNQNDPRYVHADQHALVACAPGELWAGCDGGVSHSSDSGSTWSFRGRGLNTTQYYNLAMHPTKPDWSLGGTQDNGTHLFSGGDTFAEVYGGDGGYCAISPVDPDTMYEEYVYLEINKSTNGGVSWMPARSGIDTADPVLFIAPFVMDATNPNILYAGTNRIYRTTDGAANWTPVSGAVTLGKVSAIGVGPSTGGVVFSGGSRGEVYRCDNPKDAIPVWASVTAGLPDRYVTSLTVAADEQTVFATFSGTGTPHIYKSTNRGGAWTSLEAGLPGEPFNSLVIHPADSMVLYAGSDFGVYASFDAGANWAPYGTALPRAAVDSLQISASRGLLQAATHGRGVWQTQAQTTGVLSVRPTAVPASGGAPLSVAFTANTAGGTAPYEFAWAFGDGATGSGQTVSHTYSTLGSYAASVTVTDAMSATASASVGISVVVPPPSITSIIAMTNPLRLKVLGTNFKVGATIRINGTPAPSTAVKSDTKLLSKGSTLKTLLPKGTQVMVTVVNTDGGESEARAFTRY
jgi:photosystem II stability/assembly factor-like uncharacterized protein